MPWHLPGDGPLMPTWVLQFPQWVWLWSVNLVFMNMVKVPLSLLILLMSWVFILLCTYVSLILRAWEALQDWKNPKSFNELWKWILTGAKTVCGMTERKAMWSNSLMYELREYCIWAHIISFVTKLISWFYKMVWLVWLVFEKVLSDYFFFVDFFFLFVCF